MKTFVAFTVLILAAALQSPAAAQSNAVLARRVFAEILTAGHFENADQWYSAGFVNHGLHASVGLHEDQAAARGWKAAFPDLVISVDQTIAEGDLVTVLWRARGTNSATGNGLPATGKSIDMRGITIWKFRQGQITDEWSEFDATEMLRQLGLPCSSGQTATRERR